MSKYHNTKIAAAGQVFDSKAERDFFLLCLLPLQQRGTIKEIEFQPRFELQPGFKKNGKRYRPIFYIADFLIKYKNGTEEVIDVKGIRTQIFRIKQKMFEYRYRDKTLKCVYSKSGFQEFIKNAIMKGEEKNEHKKE